MRIIKEGIDPLTVPIETTCTNCNTIFEFLQTEVRIIRDQRDGDYFLMVCPLCSVPVSVAK